MTFRVIHQIWLTEFGFSDDGFRRIIGALPQGGGDSRVIPA
jgi:hypothetical protein